MVGPGGYDGSEWDDSEKEMIVDSDDQVRIEALVSDECSRNSR